MSDSRQALGGVYSRPHFRRNADYKYVVHGIQPVRVVFAKGLISVGCTDAEPEVLRDLLREYDRWNATSPHVHQEGR